MSDKQPGAPGIPEPANAREIEYWNSPAARTWSDRYEPIDRLLEGLTRKAMEFAAPAAGERVLDIGCGSGTTLLELATRVGRHGRVLGADVAQASVARARERIGQSDLPQADVVLADAATHVFEPGAFDLAFSRFGVMFFADPVAAFANVRRALKPSGRLALTVFRTPQENRWASGPAAVIRPLVPPVPTPGPEDPGQFSWADPARVRRILEGAGFRDVSLTPHDPEIRLAGPGGAAQAAAFMMTVGPAVRATQASPELTEPVRQAMETFFASVEGPQGIVLPGGVWLIAARA